MATKAQTEANRSNSQSSTGPKTEAGKSASSLNAFKHGLACGRLLIEGEDKSDFESLRNNLRAEHDPESTTERLLVEQMATTLWLARRAVCLQAAAFDREPGCVPKDLAVLMRYQTTNERAFQKALDTLRKLQKERRLQEKDDRIGFVAQATPEELMQHLDQAYLASHPGEPLPDFTPEERQQMLDAFRIPKTPPKNTLNAAL